MRFKITGIDESGFQGRDHHPERRHVGLTVRALRLETFVTDLEDGSMMEALVDGVVHPRATALAERGLGDGADYRVAHEYFEDCWTCITADGELLELMNHEVEVER